MKKSSRNMENSYSYCLSFNISFLSPHWLFCRSSVAAARYGFVIYLCQHALAVGGVFGAVSIFYTRSTLGNLSGSIYQIGLSARNTDSLITGACICLLLFSHIIENAVFNPRIASAVGLEIIVCRIAILFFNRGLAGSCRTGTFSK